MRLCGLCLLVYCTLLLCVGCLDCPAVVSLGVTPPIIDLEVPGGGSHVMDLTVYNAGDTALKVTVYATAIELGPEGTPFPLETAEGKWSCAGWITLDNGVFELAPEDQTVVHATLKVPNGSSGGRYAAILFEATQAAVEAGPGDIAIGTRVGAIVLETIPHTLVRSGEIKEVEVLGRSADQLDFVVHFLNTGNVHLKATGSIAIKDSEGSIVDRVPLEVGTGTVLPDGVRKFRGTWSNPRRMEKGAYTGEVRVSCPGMGAALGSVDFSLE
jgi:hypothetical protein